MTSKNEYFASLRQKWNLAREAVTQFVDNDELSAEHQKALSIVPKMSPTGFMFVRLQMNAQGLEGIPGIDARTFDGWKQAGFRVKKGEHSTLDGITWVGGSKTDEETGEITSSSLYPKVYKLFHTSQVEANEA